MVRPYEHHRDDYRDRTDTAFADYEKRETTITSFMIAGFSAGALTLLNSIAMLIFRRPDAITPVQLIWIALSLLVLLLCVATGLFLSIRLLSLQHDRAYIAAQVTLYHQRIGREIDEIKYAEDGDLHNPGNYIAGLANTAEDVAEVLNRPTIAAWFIPDADIAAITIACVTALSLRADRSQLDAKIFSTRKLVARLLTFSGFFAVILVSALLVAVALNASLSP